MVGIPPKRRSSRKDKTPFHQNSGILHSSIDIQHFTLNDRVLRRETYVVRLRIYFVRLCGAKLGANNQLSIVKLHTIKSQVHKDITICIFDIEI